LPARAAPLRTRVLFEAIGIDADCVQQVPNFRIAHLDGLPALDARRQFHRAVTGAQQPTHHYVERFEQAPHFTVASFGQREFVPMILPFAATVFERRHLREAILQFNALAQLQLLLGRERSHDTHRILALDFVARMHHAVGEFARGGEQQQTFAVKVEPADGNPAAAAQARQVIKYSWAALRIVTTDDLAGGLVVNEHPGQTISEIQTHQLTVDAHLIFRSDRLTDMGRHAVHADAPGDDHLFHVAQRPNAAAREHFVQALGTLAFLRLSEG
jgi:hypothetical protein